MRFETRTLGVFEVLSVRLEGDEVFDAGRLRQETLRLVEKGSRRIVVDLGGIEYLYSDSINAFVALNRRLLESSGRIGVLVPHPKVHEILVRAGLENIMRLYRTEAELLGDSRELMRQSSAWTRPAELLNAASASQIISSASLAPRPSGPNAEAPSPSASQRIPRRRTGPRIEVKPRRRGGRSLDIPSDDDPPLPPQLPSIGSESSTLRNLSLESSAFLSPPSEADRRQIARSVPLPPPMPVEPTEFKLPTDQHDGYSTDAWLLALSQKQVAEATQGQHPSAPSGESSTFLPKVSGYQEPRPPLPAAADSHSKFDSQVRWDEETPVAHRPQPTPPPPVAPKPPEAKRPPVAPSQPATGRPAEAPRTGVSAKGPTPKEDHWTSAFLDAPSTIVPDAPSQAPLSPEALLQQAMFHDHPHHTSSHGSSGADSSVLSSKDSLSGSAPSDPWALESENPEATRALSHSTPAWSPAPRQTPPPAPQPTSQAGSWFPGQGAPKSPSAADTPKPVAKSAPPPPVEPLRQAPDPSSGTASAWFEKNAAATAARAPVPAAPTSRQPQAPAPVAPKPTRGTSPAPSPAAKAPVAPPPPVAVEPTGAASAWFQKATPQAKRIEAAAPVQPATPPVAPPKAKEEAAPWWDKAPAEPSVVAPTPPAPTPSPVAPPAPVAAPAKPRPEPDEAWLQTLRASQALPRGAAKSEPEDDWLKPAPAPIRSTPGNRRRPEPAFLDSDEGISSAGSKGKGFWIAIGLGILLFLAGLAVWSLASDKKPAEVPPVTGQTSEVLDPTSPASADPGGSTAAASPSNSEPSLTATVSKKPAPLPKAPTTTERISRILHPTTTTPPPPTPHLPPIEEDRDPVKAWVTSRPSGATVMSEGRALGTTPCEITLRHSTKLEFVKEGYKSIFQPIDPDEIHGAIQATLLAEGGNKDVGQIFISSSPINAEITLNGRLLGRTPTMVSLPVGGQKLTVKSGILSQSKVLEIQSGSNKAEHFNL